MYRFINNLLQPYLVLLLLMVLAALNLWRGRRETRRRLLWLSLPLILLLLLSTPAVSYLVLGTLEWQYAPITSRPAETQAIVVLGGGVLEQDQLRSEPVLGEDTLYRCLHAAELYRRGEPCLVIVSGGVVCEGEAPPPAAQLMKEFLAQLGVAPADVLEEDRSTSTYENARRSHELLKERGISRIVVVTEATHIPRAVRCFQALGLEVTPAPCHYLAGHFELSPFTFLPSPGAVDGIHRSLHEWIGMVWYWMHGRI